MNSYYMNADSSFSVFSLLYHSQIFFYLFIALLKCPPSLLVFFEKYSLLWLFSLLFLFFSSAFMKGILILLCLFSDLIIVLFKTVFP